MIHGGRSNSDGAVYQSTKVTNILLMLSLGLVKGLISHAFFWCMAPRELKGPLTRRTVHAFFKIKARNFGSYIAYLLAQAGCDWTKRHMIFFF